MFSEWSETWEAILTGLKATNKWSPWVVHGVRLQAKGFFFLLFFFFVFFCFQRTVGEKMVREAVKRFRAWAAGYSGVKISCEDFEIEIVLSSLQVRSYIFYLHTRRRQGWFAPSPESKAATSGTGLKVSVTNSGAIVHIYRSLCCCVVLGY